MYFKNALFAKGQQALHFTYSLTSETKCHSNHIGEVGKCCMQCRMKDTHTDILFSSAAV